jgi:hypothetical protein
VTRADRAYLTLAQKDPRYLEMAVDLALSVRRWDALPFVLCADDELAERAQARFPGVFDEIVRLEPRWRGGHQAKLGAGSLVAADFAETLYLDADCLVLADPASIWAGASAEPLTFVGERLRRGDDTYHHGFSTRALMERFGLDAYLKTNSGVFHARRDGGPAALEACFRCFVDEIVPRLSRPRLPWRLIGDELAIGVTGGRRGFGTFEEPGPMCWAQDMRALDPARPFKPVLHFIVPMPARTLSAVLDGVRERRRRAGLPPEDSVAGWTWKARRSGYGWFLQRAHRRLVGRAT